MSSIQKIIYLSFFSLFLIISLFAIFKLIQLNKNTSQSPSQPKKTSLETQNINWSQTEQLIANCQIKSVFQKRDLTITLRSYDNQIYQTTQSKLDDIFKLAKKYQTPCDIIQMISE
jgi:hypothetical protein